MEMSYAVADVAVALDSVSQICDQGAEVTFTKTGGHIKNKNGDVTAFARVGDTYVRDVWIPRPADRGQSPFKGQRPAAS